jgi:hypothetical protein
MAGRGSGRVLCIRFGSDMEPIMATVTLKDLPADLHRKLKARAEQNGRGYHREGSPEPREHRHDDRFADHPA